MPPDGSRASPVVKDRMLRERGVFPVRTRNPSRSWSSRKILRLYPPSDDMVNHARCIESRSPQRALNPE